jgi:hypothetical protein
MNVTGASHGQRRTRLEKFGRRDHLTVAWRRTPVAGNAASDPAGG